VTIPDPRRLGRADDASFRPDASQQGSVLLGPRELGPKQGRCLCRHIDLSFRPGILRGIARTGH
jgi:hypothetical protein